MNKTNTPFIPGAVWPQPKDYGANLYALAGMSENQGIDVSRYTVPTTQIIEENDQNLLIMVRDSMRNGCFIIGDVANKYLVGTISKRAGVSSDNIFDAIGKLCGKSARTVRYYSRAAAFYSTEDRIKYESLPFSFFAYAMEYNDRYQEVLDVAMLNPQYSLGYVKKLMTDANRLGKFSETKSGNLDVQEPYSESEEDEEEMLDSPVEDKKIMPRSEAPASKRGIILLCTLVGDLLGRVEEMAAQMDDEVLKAELIQSIRSVKNVASRITQKYVYGI